MPFSLCHTAPTSLHVQEKNLKGIVAGIGKKKEALVEMASQVPGSVLGASDQPSAPFIFTKLSENLREAECHA